MPRISLPSPADMNPDQLRVYDKIISGRRGKIQGPLRAALHNANLADRWQALGELLRYNTTLSPRQSELAILVTARACQSPFEWYAHRLEAEKVGVEGPVIDALLAETFPRGLQADDAAVVFFALELNRSRSVSDVTYADALSRFGERTVVELTALIGYYTMVAMTLNAHEIPLPEGVEPAFDLPHRKMA
jgi:4-carboxymuconolactone decarboxylase